MCCVTSVLNVAASMDSTIMIGESDGEVIDLDSSCDNSKIICLNDNSIYESTNDKGRFSPTEDAGANNEIHGTTSIDVGGRDMPLARSDDDAPQPIFKVMFRDGNVSRYETTLYALFTTCARARRYLSLFIYEDHLSYHRSDMCLNVCTQTCIMHERTCNLVFFIKVPNY